MKLQKIAKYSLATTVLSLCAFSLSGTTGSAVHAFGLGSTKSIAEQTPATSPQIEAAAQRVETAKTNLDLARKRLDATKALVRAAEAEYRAARTEKEALVLNTQAQQLADASGLPKNGENAPAIPAGVPGTIAPSNPALNGTTPPEQAPVYSNENTIDSTAGSLGAPAPSGQ